MTRRNEAKLEYVTADMPREIAVPMLLARLLTKARLTETGCLEYRGHLNDLGYAQVSLAGKMHMAHRFVYEALTGNPIPKGEEICHSCHNRACINPYHIRSDTHQANLMDASRAKRLNGQGHTQCKRGHPLEGENVVVNRSGFRQCRLCSRARYRRRLGWPENLLYSEIVVPAGYMLDRQTGQVTTKVHRPATGG